MKTFTPRLNLALGIAEQIATAHNQLYVGTEHVFAAFLTQEDSVVLSILKDAGINSSILLSKTSEMIRLQSSQGVDTQKEELKKLIEDIQNVANRMFEWSKK